ncbi:hypothetical protein B0T22DRAFT_124710 [Podospora appendiculata]|uniref:Secreted protein n=1 Tax=Podospora appendiculata TaxID=314037 RepID=A0AAE0X723_9PEZI|nr:hypothetical protein B0T22DRAFT_124710 [Podospora appendiculata]
MLGTCLTLVWELTIAASTFDEQHTRDRDQELHLFTGTKAQRPDDLVGMEIPTTLNQPWSGPLELHYTQVAGLSHPSQAFSSLPNNSPSHSFAVLLRANTANLHFSKKSSLSPVHC